MNAKTYDKQSGKLIARIAENLPLLSADVMQRWIDNPKGLREFLWGLNIHTPSSVKKMKFPTWKTIRLGTHDDTAALKQSLVDEGLKVGEWADQIFNIVEIARREKDVDLVVRSVAELGFKNGAYYSEIGGKGQEVGLELCPNEVGPQLRRQYKDQPKGENLLVAMKSLPDSDDSVVIFSIEHHEDGLVLYASEGSSLDQYGPDDLFVFVRPQ